MPARSRRRLPPLEVRHYGRRGPRVVVLHGGPGAPGSAADLARRLGRRFRVAEPLQRPSGTVRLTMARNVADLGDVVRAPVPIVGWSWGAMWALSFAARYPHRVRSLALVGCGTYDVRTRRAYVSNLARRLDPSAHAEFAGLASRDADARRAALERVATRVEAAEAYDPVVVPGTHAGARPVDARSYDESWQDVLRRQRDGREPAAFRRIDCPVLMLHGRDDPHPGDRIARALRRTIPQLVYRPIPRCGHVPWRERRARTIFYGLLERWLAAPGAVGP